MEHKRSDEDFSPRRPSGAAVMRVTVTNALTRAFFSEWSRVGYAALSLERVARKAGVGKAALYRRWPSKSAMASDLLAQVGIALTEVRDTGSLEADVRAMLLEFRRVLRHQVTRRILSDLLAEAGREPALTAALRPIQKVRRDYVQQIVDRAMARGELHGSEDRETVLDFLIGPIYWRLVVTEGRSDPEYIERLTRMTIAAMAAG